MPIKVAWRISKTCRLKYPKLESEENSNTFSLMVCLPILRNLEQLVLRERKNRDKDSVRYKMISSLKLFSYDVLY